MTLVDLHCHILPGVDDGAKDLPMALGMARDAVAQGISHILLTPHHMDGEYTNHKVDVLRKTTAFQEALDAAKIPLTVFPGQEVHLTGELLRALDDDDILFMDEGGKYLLLELPHSGIPEYTEDMIFELQARGITPVIAHPERNHGFQKEPDRLYDFVEMGCLTQLTSSSYLGVFGDNVEKLTAKIIRSGMGFAFSSDAHNFKGRRFLMGDAFNKLEQQAGKDVAIRFNDDARAILNGEEIVIDLDHERHRYMYRVVKRVFDFVASLLGLILLSPVFLIVAIAIKLEDPKGPVFYSQTRLGKQQQPFKMYKFRSMIVNADKLLKKLADQNEVDGAMFKIKRDPRVTNVGRFIRKHSLDELPQLMNVLLGQMSLVGPRPPLTREVAEYTEYDRQRLLVKPGCTGLWQVTIRNEASFKEMVRLDLLYIRNRGVWFDVKVLVKTIGILLKPNGAY